MAGLALDFRDQPRSQQRMPTEVEEVVRDADVLAVQDVFPDARQRQFHRIAGCNAATTRESFGHRQRPPVHLAIREPRKFVHRHEDIGHHVSRENLFEVPAQLRNRDNVTSFTGDVRNKPSLAANLENCHDRLLHVFVLGKQDLDFPQFDSKTAQFDLLIEASQVLDGAVCALAAEIASTVHAPSRVGAKRIRNETLVG